MSKGLGKIATSIVIMAMLTSASWMTIEKIESWWLSAFWGLTIFCLLCARYGVSDE